MKQTKVKKPLDGMRFDRLLVLSRTDDVIKPSGGKVVSYLCRCACGVEKIIKGSSLTSGLTRSCGCYRNQRLSESNTVHGVSKHPLYVVWKHMVRRCTNDRDKHYKDYGGRGIAVCAEWVGSPDVFVEWGISNGWKKGLQIDRENNDDGYSPDNCRFVKPLKNVNNQRLLKTSNKSGYRGVSWRKTNNKWHAYINYDWKRTNLGLYDTAEKAARARDKYVVEQGLDVPLNFTLEKKDG
jgi:hypothetical protein